MEEQIRQLTNLVMAHYKKLPDFVDRVKFRAYVMNRVKLCIQVEEMYHQSDAKSLTHIDLSNCVTMLEADCYDPRDDKYHDLCFKKMYDKKNGTSVWVKDSPSEW